jgi:serine protease inhibitor ecotin
MKVEPPPKKKRKHGNPNQTTGLIGVSKNGNKFKAQIKIGGTQHRLGTFDTKEQAGIAYDQFVVDKSTEEVSFTLNYPMMSDVEREEALKVEETVQQKRGTPNQTTGLIGVSKSGKKYRAKIYIDGREHWLGSFDTKEQAGIAYDRFVVDKSTEEVSFTLNYPNMSDAEREEALIEEPIQEKRGLPNQTTGLIGVYKQKKRYTAEIGYGGTQHHLGRFDTKEEAGIAYDRFVVDKSTEEVSFTLNYPNMSDQEREEALKVEPPKKRKRGYPNQKTGLIGVYKSREKYQASITYGGTEKNLGTFDTKEQAGIAYDRFVVDKSTEEVSFTLNYPNGLPAIGTNKDGTDNSDPPTTIKPDPEAELILHKAEEEAEEVHVKEEPEAELNLHKAKEVHVKEEPEAELIFHKAKEVHVKSEPEAEF